MMTRNQRPHPVARLPAPPDLRQVPTQDDRTGARMMPTPPLLRAHALPVETRRSDPCRQAVVLHLKGRRRLPDVMQPAHQREQCPPLPVADRVEPFPDHRRQIPIPDQLPHCGRIQQMPEQKMHRTTPLLRRLPPHHSQRQTLHTHPSQRFHSIAFQRQAENAPRPIIHRIYFRVVKNDKARNLRHTELPHLREQLPADGVEHGDDGKIPAHAETTTRGGGREARPMEDPRAGGDDTEVDHWDMSPPGRSPRGGDDGSGPGHSVGRSGRSPRVRGRPSRVAIPSLRDGKIPARAGTTSMRTTIRRWCEEDPRACGDDEQRGHGSWSYRGRSPRVRGRPTRSFTGICTPGKIPARAGTTGRCPACRGESLGRSPRVRGRPCEDVRVNRGVGKIPARAGTTSSTQADIRCPTEDPRACGDDDVDAPLGTTVPGRSPRVRGRRRRL